MSIMIKKEIINNGVKVNNILVEKVPNENKSKKEKKTYKFCNNFPFHCLKLIR